MARLGLLFILIALAMAPVRMFGVGQAAAAPAHHGHHAAAAHHAPEAPPEEAPAQADCMTACAAIAPAAAPAPHGLDMAPQLVSSRAYHAASGLDPEAEPPPPRIS